MSRYDFTRKVSLLTLLLSVLLLSACSSTSSSGSTSESLNVLPEFSLNDIEQKGDTYSYTYMREETENGFIDRSLEYELVDDVYQGVLVLEFSSKEDVYVETIPKSFASHIDELDFSVEPSRIINPDPVVEFSNVKGKVEIKSNEYVDEADILANTEEQVIKGELEICAKLLYPEGLSCSLRVIAKYRYNKYLKEESEFDTGVFEDAVMSSVFHESLTHCRWLKDDDERDTCYEFAFQVLVEECNMFSGEIFRECTRHYLYGVPSIGMKKVFCDYIDDADMHDECTGRAPFWVCDEIKDANEKESCQLSIATHRRSLHLCSQIEGQASKEACYAYVGVIKKDPQYCYLINDTYYGDLCTYRIALANDDKDACRIIRDEDVKNQCLLLLVKDFDSFNQDLCDELEGEYLKDFCGLFVGVKKGDKKICSTVDDGNFDKALCYSLFGVLHSHESSCSKVVSSDDSEQKKAEIYLRDLCYTGVAINKSKIKLCDEVEDADLKRQCIEGIGGEENEDIPLPAWMSCPVPKGAELDIWQRDDSAGSGYKYRTPDKPNRAVGPYLKYYGHDFDKPKEFICYDDEGKKTGPFEMYSFDGYLTVEGAYADDEYDGTIKRYSAPDMLKSLETYKKGVRNGPSESYGYFVDSPSYGKILQKGEYKDGKRDGLWTFYKFGEPTSTEEYNMGVLGESTYLN